jgi:hypothetical protein
MPRVTLSDGRSMEMRPIYVSDRLAIIELNERRQDSSAPITDIEYLKALAAIAEPAVIEKSWPGSLLEMPELELLALMFKWRKASEDDAVPPVSGASSRKRSPRRNSVEPTESQPESASR